MIKIQKNTLKDLEFPTVLEQIAAFCITEMGKDKVLEILPYSEEDAILPELQRVKEFTASFENDNRIPNHGFEAITKELRLLEIENSVIEASGFRRILSVTETTKELLKFFKKYEEFYTHLQSYATTINYTSLISEAIQNILDKYGEVKDDASPALFDIRKRLQQVKTQVSTSFSRALSRYAQADYLDEIKESVMENRRVLAVRQCTEEK